MRRAIAIAICLIFLASGLVRIFAGIGMMGQESGWWVLGGEFPDALADTHGFFATRETNLVGFTPFSYLAWIAFMGVTISLGAIGQLRRKRWGLVLILVYLASHAFLFVNFAEVNPKIFVLVGSIVLTLILVWANRPPEPAAKPISA